MTTTSVAASSSDSPSLPKELALHSVSVNGRCLEHLPEFQDDEEIVAAALQQLRSSSACGNGDGGLLPAELELLKTCASERLQEKLGNQDEDKARDQAPISRWLRTGEPVVQSGPQWEKWSADEDGERTLWFGWNGGSFDDWQRRQKLLSEAEARTAKPKKDSGAAQSSKPSEDEELSQEQKNARLQREFVDLCGADFPGLVRIGGGVGGAHGPGGSAYLAGLDTRVWPIVSGVSPGGGKCAGG